jgi:hypothetical protein
MRGATIKIIGGIFYVSACVGQMEVSCKAEQLLICQREFFNCISYSGGGYYTEVKLRGPVDRFLPHLTRVASLLFPAISYTVKPAYNGITVVSRQSAHEGGTGRLYPQEISLVIISVGG